MSIWFKSFIFGAAVVLLFASLSFVARGSALANYRFWAPQEEAARRQVYEESPSYVHGKRQYLARLHGQWRIAEGAAKDALCSTARHEASTLDPRHLPETLTAWECVR